MANDKTIELEERSVQLIRHMQSVDTCRAELNNLQSIWDSLSLLGQLSGTGSDMNSTRQAFQKLTGDLLNQLSSETLRKTVSEMQAKAQVAIDILIRNLFERTADIGFLATDQDIVQLLQTANNSKGQYCRKTILKDSLGALQQRFAEYVAKYSVYHDIVLFDLEGEILLRLQEQSDLERTQHPFFKEALNSTEAYVETFDQVDFLPTESASLIYSFRVVDENNQALGVLSLCFRFQNEMTGIFANLVSAEDWSVITILDGRGQVIASSDPFHVALGARFNPVLTADYAIQRFAGQEYLATTCRSHAYQGYAGPHWYAHIMLPLQQAFNQENNNLKQKIKPKIMESIREHSQLFSTALRTIPKQAEHIQRTLNRSVWNGNIRQSRSGKSKDSSFSKILLWEISNTGARTQAVFQQAIDNLNETVISSVLENSQFQASLAIDIMDRNLYERANDCRWWALTSSFRSLLAAEQITETDKAEIGNILSYINSLYTVYTNLFVFDINGCILASSNPQEASLSGKNVGEEWCRRVLNLSNSQAYAVSAFKPTPFYQDKPSYIYGAAIRDIHEDKVIGGIGIVFDAEPQFSAMLQDALPKNASGHIDPSSFAVFVAQNGKVIASSDDRFQPGDSFPLATVINQLNPCESLNGVYNIDNHYYALGAQASKGYREYKNQEDPYQNTVIAVVAKQLCALSQQAEERSWVACPVIHSDRGQDDNSIEIATFRLGEEWFGLRAKQILEAVDCEHITPAPGAGTDCVGYLVYQGIPIPVFDIRQLICVESNRIADEVNTSRQVMVIEKNADTRFGVIADSLGDIPEIEHARLTALPPFLAGGALLADAAITPDNPEQDCLLLVLSSERLSQQLATNFNEHSLSAISNIRTLTTKTDTHAQVVG